MLRKFKPAAVALALSAAFAAPAFAQGSQFINVLTGGTSGVYYPLGVALAKIYGDKIPGARTQVQATKASVENLILIDQGRGEIAFSLGDSVQFGWEGNTDAGFTGKLTKLRGIAAIYPNFLQIVATKESGIKDIATLKGRSLSVGAPKSGTELNTRAVFGAAAMTYKDLGKIEYLPFAESVDLMKNRQLDSTLQSAGLGVASIRDLAVSVPVTIVAIPADLVAKIGPPYVAAVIPAKTYPGQDADVPTAAVGNFLITRSDLSDETVYQMTKQLWENLPALEAAHAAAKDMKMAEAVKGMPVPLHPGAERYYREKGIIK